LIQVFGDKNDLSQFSRLSMSTTTPIPKLFVIRKAVKTMLILEITDGKSARAGCHQIFVPQNNPVTI